jgi:hypothetical protein
MSATKTAPDASELFGQSMRMFETAMRTGAKVQEESARWFSGMVSNMASPQGWQKRTEEVINETISITQKNVEEALRVMNQNARTGIELLQKAFEARQADSPTDAQTKSRELWETALGALRANTEAVLQANSRWAESWAEVTRRLAGETENHQPA